MESLYDHPRYYDLLFGSDWKAEFDFLRGCFQRFADRPVRNVFEPACGTGRLLVKLAQAGLRIGGNDLNRRAVAYCNARLARYGLRQRVTVGDMSDFELRRPVDAAFNMINSFRHLPSEATAAAHLRCVARALVPRGIYVLGLHLTPTGAARCEEESWSARRGHLAVLSRMVSLGIDRRARVERIGMTVDVYTPRRQFRLEEEMNFRTYSAPQMNALLASVPELEPIATFDFCYDLDAPIEVDGRTEDVIWVLRKRSR